MYVFVYRNTAQRSNCVFTKGAVERVIELCTSIETGNLQQKMTEENKIKVVSQMTMLASQGLRVIDIARRLLDDTDASSPDTPREFIERDLTFLGLAGI